MLHITVINELHPFGTWTINLLGIVHVDMERDTNITEKKNKHIPILGFNTHGIKTGELLIINRYPSIFILV